MQAKGCEGKVLPCAEDMGDMRDGEPRKEEVPRCTTSKRAEMEELGTLFQAYMSSLFFFFKLEIF